MTVQDAHLDNGRVDNGVNVDHLLGAKKAMTEMPAAAQFQFRAGCQWINGTHSTCSVSSFFGVGEERSHRQEYTVDTDHPEVFASQDNGPTPPELLLMGLAGCLTAGIAAVATHRSIKLHSVRATVTGEMDVRGILGIDTDIRNGFSSIAVQYQIEGDAPRSDLEAVVAQSQKRSAVYDIITNPTNVTVELV
jgi:uncharacterized OsmC-like protein